MVVVTVLGYHRHLIFGQRFYDFAYYGGLAGACATCDSYNKHSCEVRFNFTNLANYCERICKFAEKSESKPPASAPER